MGLRQGISVTVPGASFLTVVSLLESAEWRVADVSGVSYVPAEADDHDWAMFTDVSPDEAKKACRLREQRGAIPAVNMMFGDTGFGSSLTWSRGQVLVGSVDIGVPDPFDLTMASSILRALIDGGLAIAAYQVSVVAGD